MVTGEFHGQRAVCPEFAICGVVLLVRAGCSVEAGGKSFSGQ